MKLLRNRIITILMIILAAPESISASRGFEHLQVPAQQDPVSVLAVMERHPASQLSSVSLDAVQNKAYAHLEIDSANTASYAAAFTHPDNPDGEVMIECFLYAWDQDSPSQETLMQYVQTTGIGYAQTQGSRPVPVYNFYLLRCKNKIRNMSGNWTQLFTGESRWSRLAPYNGIWERTGEVTSFSAVLHTYLTEKPAFQATAEANLSVPPMAGQAQFSVFRDQALLDKVTESGFFPVDDYIQAGTEWRRTNYNFRWTVNGLEPGTTYYYILETRSSDGLETRLAGNVNSFTTPPLADAEEPIVFVVVSCLDVYNTAYPNDPGYENLGLKVFESMLSDPPPDFVILQGDTVYYDGGDGYSPDVGTTERYNFRWLYWYAQYQFTNFMTFFQHVPGYWMVDDHDYWGNNINETMPDGWTIFRNVNPTPGEYGTVGENDPGYYNNNPYLNSAGDGQHFWRSIRWGKDVEIFIEESRDHRDFNNGLIWGAEQRQWLEQQIRESEATFKILVVATPLLGPAVPDSTYPSVIPDKHVNDYFRAETEQFLYSIRDVENVIFLAGDRHYKYHSIINSANFPALSGFQEFGSGSAAAPPHAAAGGIPDSDLATLVFSDIQVGASAGYLRVEIIPHQDDRAEIILKLIRVTETLDNDIVFQKSLTVDRNKTTPHSFYLPIFFHTE